MLNESEEIVKQSSGDFWQIRKHSLKLLPSTLYSRGRRWEQSESHSLWEGRSSWLELRTVAISIAESGLIDDREAASLFSITSNCWGAMQRMSWSTSTSVTSDRIFIPYCYAWQIMKIHILSPPPLLQFIGIVWHENVQIFTILYFFTQLLWR